MVKKYETEVQSKQEQIEGCRRNIDTLQTEQRELCLRFQANIKDRDAKSVSEHCNLVLTFSFYPTPFKGCRGIVFTHGVRMGGRAAGNSLSGLYLRNRKV